MCTYGRYPKALTLEIVAYIKFADFWKQPRREACDEDTPRISFVDKAIVMTVHRDLNVVNTPETYAGADVNKRVFCFHGFALREKQHRIRYGAQRVQHTRYTASLLIRPSPNALIHFAEAMQRNAQAH
jgi:hypothetical protein